MGVGSGWEVLSKNISALITLKFPGGRGLRFEGPEKRTHDKQAYIYIYFHVCVCVCTSDGV